MHGGRHLVWILGIVAAGVLGAAESSAQVVGTFRWRFEPFCNVVTLTIVQQGSSIALSGFDDDCGFSGGWPASGTLFVGQGGAVGGSVTVIGLGAVAINNLIQINPATGSGTWSDNFSQSGAFQFEPSIAPGQPRPILNERVFAFGQIREDASIRSASSRVVSVNHPATGVYCIVFSSAPTQIQLEGSVVGLAGAGSDRRFARVSNGQGGGCGSGAQLEIRIVNETGAAADGRFSFVVP